jgi:hypothetical protein
MDGPGALPPAGLPQSRTCGFPASGSSTHASPCAVAGPPCFAFRRLRKFAIRPSSLRCFRAAPFKRCRVPTAPFPHRVARAAIAASPLLRAAVTPRRAFHFISSSFVPQYRSRPLGGGLDRLSQRSGEPSGCVCLALQLRLVLSRLAVKDDAEPGVAVGGPLQPVAHSVSRLLVSPPSQRVDAAPDAGRPRARASSHFRTHSLGLRARRVRFAGLQRGFVNSSTLISSHPGLACRKTQSGSIPARRGERSTEEAAMTLYGGSLPRVYHLVSVRRGSTS